MDIGKAISGITRTALGVVTGGLTERIIDIVDEAAGDDLSPEQKLKIRLGAQGEITARERIAAETADQQEKNVTERVAKLEGTAKDLMSVPILGPLVLFIRGTIRPGITILVGVIDYRVFTGDVVLVQQAGDVTVNLLPLLVTINLVVLGFWFGERAFKNVAPLAAQFLTRR